MIQVEDLDLANLRFIGIDLGKQMDYSTAVILKFTDEYVVERALRDIELERWAKSKSAPANSRVLLPEFEVAVLPRWPLGTDHQDIAQDIYDMLQSPGLRDKEVSIAVDVSGPGAEAVVVFEALRISTLNIVVTGGHAESVKKGRDGRVRHHVSKSVLVPPLRAMIEPPKRLHIRDTTDEARILLDELTHFDPSRSMKDSSTIDDIIGRQHEHDDLVLALASAVWLTQVVPTQPVDPTLSDSGSGPFGPLDDDDLFKLDDSVRFF